MRWFHAADPIAGATLNIGSQIGPVLASVFGYPNLAVVGANPQNSGFEVRFFHRYNGEVGHRAGAVGVQRVVGSQVGTDFGPAVSTVG